MSMLKIKSIFKPRTAPLHISNNFLKTIEQKRKSIYERKKKQIDPVKEFIRNNYNNMENRRKN